MGGNLAIIPARGGSKRIARKNIRPFAGRPILAWSVKVARQSRLFDRVMVSTDDAGIAEVARAAGAEVPFLRSGENADDHATIADVLREVIAAYAQEGEHFDRVACLFATAPMMQAGDLKRGLACMDDGSFDVVIPVARFGYPIQRSLSRGSDGALRLNFPEHANTRSQDLEPAYHDAGQWVWTTPGFLESGAPLLGPGTGSIVLDGALVEDIDTEEDWRRAEWKFEHMREALGHGESVDA